MSLQLMLCFALVVASPPLAGQTGARAEGKLGASPAYSAWSPTAPPSARSARRRRDPP